MDRYDELPKTIEEMMKQLFEIFQVKNPKELSRHLEISESTLSRNFSAKCNNKNGSVLKVENAEKIVAVFAGYKKIDASVVRKHMYNLIYPPQYVEEKLKEFENMQNKSDYETTVDMDEEDLKQENLEEENVLQNVTEKKEAVLKKIKAVLEKIAEDCNFCIECYKNSEKSEIGGLLYVSHDYSCVFNEPHIDLLFGIYLTEANYIKTVHDIAELDTRDGIIILFYEEETVFDRAWRDDKLEVENNVLLYCLSKERKICVKSTKQNEKKFLKHLLGKEKLFFPHK